MNKHKIFELYDVLTPAERVKLRRWLQFKIADETDVIFRLYDALRGRKNAEKIWRKIYGEKPFDKQLFKSICEKLTELAEAYLAQKQLLRNPAERDFFLMQALKGKKDQRLFEKEIKKVNNRLENQPLRDARYFRLKYELKAMQQEHLILTQRPGRKAHYSEMYQAHQEMLLLEYIKGAMIARGLKGPALPQAYRLALHETGEDAPLHEMLTVYLALYHLNEASPSEAIHQCLEKVKQQSAHIPLDEKHNFSSILLNLAIQKIQHSDSPVYQELIWNIYQWAIAENLLAIDQFMLSRHFKNIINVFLNVGRIQEARSFFEEHLPQLPGQERAEAETYNQALIHFFAGQFERTSVLLKKRRFTNKVYKFPADLLRISAAYEQGYDIALENAIESAKKYLNRSMNLNASAYKRYAHFLDVLDLMVRDKPPQLVRQKFKGFDIVYKRQWLEQKMEAYLARTSK
ncbi:MAG: hypothetical protein AAFR61_05470 [Bacteroidota bacterium]